MLLTDSASIRDVLLFPTMKPIDQEKRAAAPTETQAQETPVAAEVSRTPAVSEKIDFSNVEIEPLFADYVDFETFSKSDFRAVKVLACEAVKKSKKLLRFTLDDGSGTERTILSRHPRVLRAGRAGRQDLHRHYQPAAARDDGH